MMRWWTMCSNGSDEDEYTQSRSSTRQSQERVDIYVRTDSTVKWLDVTVTDPTGASIVDQAASNQGAAARRAEGQKRSKYKELAKRLDATVIPLAFETSGYRGPAAEKFFREVQAASASSDETAPDRLELFEQLTVTLQKMNVEMCREAGRKAMGVRQSKRRFVNPRRR
jgi:hypothetical protein